MLSFVCGLSDTHGGNNEKRWSAYHMIWKPVMRLACTKMILFVYTSVLGAPSLIAHHLIIWWDFSYISHIRTSAFDGAVLTHVKTYLWKMWMWIWMCECMWWVWVYCVYINITFAASTQFDLKREENERKKSQRRKKNVFQWPGDTLHWCDNNDVTSRWLWYIYISTCHGFASPSSQSSSIKHHIFSVWPILWFCSVYTDSGHILHYEHLGAFDFYYLMLGICWILVHILFLRPSLPIFVFLASTNLMSSFTGIIE